MTQKQGLWIAGERMGRSPYDVRTTLKFALVPEDRQSHAGFQSCDIDDVLSLADDLNVEIVNGILNDYAAHEFDDVKELGDNIELRKGVIAAMQSICAGDVDADYVERTVGVPPTLGCLKNLETLWAPGAASGQSILTKNTPFSAPQSSWDHVPDTSS